MPGGGKILARVFSYGALERSFRLARQKRSNIHERGLGAARISAAHK